MVSQPYSDIVFACHGKLYISGELMQLPTDDPRSPVIMIRSDMGAAFILKFNEIGVMAVEPLSARGLNRWLAHVPEGDSADVLRKCASHIEGDERRKARERRIKSSFESPSSASVFTEN